jgi:ADP-heptose:LPS heptosyltransferase
MHTLTALRRDIQVQSLRFPVRSPMLVEDVNAGEVLAMSPENELLCRPWQVPEPITNPTPRSVLFILPGGFGDLILLSAVLAEAFRVYGAVAIACSPLGAPVFENLPFPLEVLPYPLPVGEVDRFDLVVPLEGIIMRNPGKHPVDLWSEAAGLALNMEERHAIYRIRDEERAEALENHPRSKRKRVGMQARASALCRTYPAKHQIETIRELAAKDYEIFIFGGPGECLLANEPPYLVNLCLYKLSFRQSAAMLSTCDAVITPDSSLCHVAGALDLPTVALYGPFPWQSRTIYHPSIYPINGHAECAPCHYHKRGGWEWPEGGPCRKTGQCEALASITPERVVAKVEEMIRKAESEKAEKLKSD